MKWLLIFFLLIFCFYFFLFKDRVWFFNDDFDFLVGNLNFSSIYLFLPHNEHFIPIHKLLFHVMFSFFSLNFTPYFILSVCLHLLNLLILWFIIKRLTDNKFFAYLAVLLFSVKVTFFEVILQNNFSALFCSLFMGVTFLFWLKLRQKPEIKYLLIIISSLFAAFLSFSVALGYPLVLAFISYFDKKSAEKIALIFLALEIVMICVYFYFNGGESFSLWPSFIQISLFLYTGLVEALTLRFLFPLFPTRFLGLNQVLMPFLIIVSFLFLGLIFILSSLKSKEKLFLKIVLLLNIIYPYVLMSLKRAGLSPKEALAERYAYIPLFFLVIFIVYQLSLLKPKKWYKTVYLIFIFYFLAAQSLVFYKRSYIFTKQMIINKKFFLQLKEKVKNNQVEETCKIPKFANGRQDPCSRYLKLFVSPDGFEPSASPM